MNENETVKSITYEYLKDHKACGLKQFFEKCKNVYFQFIMNYTNQLDSKYTFTHRLFWTINCITQFPKCTLCNNDNKRVIRSLNEGYCGTMQYCCHKCCVRSEHCIETRKQSTFEHLGVYVPAQSKIKYIFHKKSYKLIQTCMPVFIKNTKNCILNIIQ